MALQPLVEHGPELGGGDGADGAFPHVADSLLLNELAAEVGHDLPEESAVGSGEVLAVEIVP